VTGLLLNDVKLSRYSRSVTISEMKVTGAKAAPLNAHRSTACVTTTRTLIQIHFPVFANNRKDVRVLCFIKLVVGGGGPLILSHMMARPARAFAEGKSFGASTSTQVII